MKPQQLVSLSGRGWPAPCTCIALVRLRDRPGFAVGLQSPGRRDGVGAVWKTLPAARRRASILAVIHRAPVLEAI